MLMVGFQPPHAALFLQHSHEMYSLFGKADGRHSQLVSQPAAMRCSVACDRHYGRQ